MQCSKVQHTGISNRCIRTSNTSGTVIAGGNFLRADAADTTTGALTIDADGGIIIGDAQELSITVSSNDVTIAQTSQDKDLKFTVNDWWYNKDHNDHGWFNRKLVTIDR